MVETSGRSRTAECQRKKKSFNRAYLLLSADNIETEAAHSNITQSTRQNTSTIQHRQGVNRTTVCSGIQGGAQKVFYGLKLQKY